MGKRTVLILALFFLILAPYATAQNLCSHNIAKDKLEIISIKDNTQTNETNWLWSSKENVSIEVRANNKNLTGNNFQLKLFFLDSGRKEKNITTDYKNMTKAITLQKNESKTFTFSFQLAEPKRKIYYLYAQLLDRNNNTICTNLEASSINAPTTINIEQKQKIIIIQNITGPKNVIEGSLANYTATIINLGSETEPQVLAVLYNTKLKIRKGIKILNLKPQQTKTVIFNLTIPQNITSGENQLFFSTEYSYKNETDFYYESANKAKIFSIQIKTKKPTQDKTIIKKQIMPTNNRTENKTASPTKTEKNTPSYFWPIIITIFLIMLIMLIIYLIIRYNKKEYFNTYSENITPANEYVKKIQEAES